MDHRAGAALTAICFKYGPLEYSQRLKHKGASDEQVYKILAQSQDNKNLDDKGVIVGLHAKGDARTDDSGFVVKAVK